MKTDISEKTNKEIEKIIEKFVDNNYEQIDLQVVERNITVNINNKSENKPLFFALYPELLFYDDKIIPWICIKTEIEYTDENILYKFADFIKKEMEKCSIPLFMDEDAFSQHFSKDEHEGWTKLKCYTNPVYPEGYWENHTL